MTSSSSEGEGWNGVLGKGTREKKRKMEGGRKGGKERKRDRREGQRERGGRGEMGTEWREREREENGVDHSSVFPNSSTA